MEDEDGAALEEEWDDDEGIGELMLLGLGLRLELGTGSEEAALLGGTVEVETEEIMAELEGAADELSGVEEEEDDSDSEGTEELMVLGAGEEELAIEETGTEMEMMLVDNVVEDGWFSRSVSIPYVT